MHADDVMVVIDTLRAAEIAVWVDGGWGVDALIGQQTRPHDDLDVVIDESFGDDAIRRLASAGFHLTEDARPTRFVLCDERDRRIDVHPVRFDDNGGWQTLPDGSMFCYPTEGLLGSGIVAGQQVQCLTPELQVRCHLGYEPDANDIHDMLLLHKHFGIVLPRPYSPSEYHTLSALKGFET